MLSARLVEGAPGFARGSGTCKCDVCVGMQELGQSVLGMQHDVCGGACTLLCLWFSLPCLVAHTETIMVPVCMPA